MADSKWKRKKMEMEMEEKAIKAATWAAEPYHEAMAKAQWLTVEYNRKAQELVAASKLLSINLCQDMNNNKSIINKYAWVLVLGCSCTRSKESVIKSFIHTRIRSII